MFQANFPESTITPPMQVPCPLMYLVAEATTISAPRSSGRTNPTPIVLSTISGTPASCAIFDNAAKSGTSSFGFPTVSANTARVFEVIARLNSSGFRESTNFTVRPRPAIV